MRKLPKLDPRRVQAVKMLRKLNDAELVEHDQAADAKPTARVEIIDDETVIESREVFTPDEAVAVRSELVAKHPGKETQLVRYVPG